MDELIREFLECYPDADPIHYPRRFRYLVLMWRMTRAR